MNDVKPTVKQEKAFKNAVENGGSMGEAMINAGYSEATAKTPQKLTESRGWEILLDEYMPDDLLAQKNLELLKSNNWKAVNAGLDKAYKIKGKYKDKLEVEHTITAFKKYNELED